MKNHLVNVGWKYEGIGWYSDTSKSVPLYRAYNPNAKAGSHNYTVNYGEQKNLLRVGWRNEGIAWYGINPNQNYTVKVVHKGSDGKILSEQTTSVKRDTNYTASSKSFSGYTLKGSNKQTVKVDGNKTMTFNYTKNSIPATQKYKVTVKYLCGGERIKSDEVYEVEKGKNYTVKALKLASDEFELIGNDTQTVTVNEEMILTFNYKRSESALAKELSDAKTKALNDINAMNYLSTDQKGTFTKQINTASTKVTVQDVVNSAKSKNDEIARELATMKTKAVNDINAMKFLQVNQKTDFIKQMNAATTKDMITNIVASAKAQNTIEQELTVIKTKSTTDINTMKYLQADQKVDFVKQANTATTKDAVTKVVESAKAQDAIEAKKGTITFNVYDFDGKHVKSVSKRVMEGSYSFTLADLGLAGSNMVYLSGDLTGSVKAQETKDVKINIVDTKTVQTVIIYARDSDTGAITNKKTLYYKAGDKYTVSSDLLDVDKNEWELTVHIDYLPLTAKAGKVSEYTFDYDKLTDKLTEDQCREAEQELLRLINEYRTPYGLNALATDSRLDAAADVRATEIAENFDHTRPNGSLYNTAIQEAGLTGYGMDGENIASFGSKVSSGKIAAQRLFEQWKQSPFHNANMLQKGYTHVSFGVYADKNDVYATTLFVAM